MPRNIPKGWEGPPHYRWVKMHQGKRYRVTCSDLGLPRELWTEEGSYQARNGWWEAKPRTLGALLDLDPTSHENKRRIEWAKEHQPEAVAELERLDQMESSDDQEHAGFVMNFLRNLGVEFPDDLDPVVIREVFGRQEIWRDRFAREKTVPKERTIGQAIDGFLAILARHQKPKTFADIKDFLEQLRDFGVIHSGMDVANLDEAKVEAVSAKLAGSDLSQSTRKKRWGYFRRFVREGLVMRNLLPTEPRNLTSKALSFKVSATKIKTWDEKTITASITGLPDRLRCWALLASNCGMTNADIGALRHDMVQDGYLTRRRVKTGDNDNVPTVTYKLWPETQGLLDKFKSSHPDLWFLSEAGTPLVANWIEDGKAHMKDLIALRWQKTKHIHKCPIPLAKFRSVAATLLESHTHYGRYASYFLGHSPKTLKDKHYAAPSQDVFDAALVWLHQRIFGK